PQTSFLLAHVPAAAPGPACLPIPGRVDKSGCRHSPVDEPGGIPARATAASPLCGVTPDGLEPTRADPGELGSPLAPSHCPTTWTAVALHPNLRARAYPALPPRLA